MNEKFENLTIDSKKIPVSWNKQQEEINERLSEGEKSFSGTHRWIAVTALIVLSIISGLLLKDHQIKSRPEVIEMTYFEEELPESLIVLNDVDYDKTNYEELIDFIVPFEQGGVYYEE